MSTEQAIASTITDSNNTFLVWNPKKGWPSRPSTSTAVIWIDENGGASKPPLKNGDIYLKAAPTSTNHSLLLPTIENFTSGWTTVGGASLSGGKGLLPTENSGLTIDQIPVTVGKKVTFSVTVEKGSVSIVLQFWNGSTSWPGVWTIGGPGTISVNSIVPTGAKIGVVWIKYSNSSAIVNSASLMEA